MGGGTIAVAREDILSPVAGGLIGALNAELAATYPEPGATHFRLDPDEVAQGRGAFLVARCDGAPVGCGAVRLLGDGAAEVKRMFVAPPFRGLGVGAALLAALEEEARGIGARRLVLETGARQAAALRLYRGAGFREIPPYGDYTGPAEAAYLATGLSVFLGKEIPGDRPGQA